VLTFLQSDFTIVGAYNSYDFFLNHVNGLMLRAHGFPSQRKVFCRLGRNWAETKTQNPIFLCGKPHCSSDAGLGRGSAARGAVGGVGGAARGVMLLKGLMALAEDSTLSLG
jgi:hypothetical protein